MYPNKSGRVEQLLEEAKQHVTLEANGSGQLRLVDIVSHKIHWIHPPDAAIDSLTVAASKTYRIEEVLFFFEIMFQMSCLLNQALQP